MAADVRRSKKAKSVSIDATSPSEDAELVHKLATSEDDVGTVLLDAIHNDDLGAIRRLVKKYSFSNADIVKICTSDVKHAQLKTTACPLVEASRLQDAAIVSYFLFAGADANHLHEKALKGGHVTTVTPLHAAVDAASHAVADALLQAGANANVSDHRGETPLLAATRLADQNMVKLLLSKGANPAIADRQNVAPLHIGTLYGHTEIVRSLVNADADVWQRGQGGITPPQIAAREGHTHLAELFCRRGRRDINEVIPGFAPEGRSVALLHITAQYARYETTSMLIREFRADVNVRDSMGNTPLHCLSAYESSHSTIDSETVAKTAELLITKGADVTATNDVGDTPLHVAAQQHPEQGLLQTLVAAGADPHSPNANHMTPFDLLPKSDPSIKSFLQPVQDDRQMIQDVDTTSVPMDDIPATGSLKRSGSKKKKKPKDDDLTSPKGSVSEDVTKVPESKPEVPEKRRKSSSKSSKTNDDAPKKSQKEIEDDSKCLSLERTVPLVDAPETELSVKLSLNELENLRSRAPDPQVTDLDAEIEPDLGPLPEPPKAKPRYKMELDLDRNVPVAGRPFSGRYSGIEMPMSPAPPPPDTLPPSPPKGYEGDDYMNLKALDQLVPEARIDINKNKVDEPIYLNVSGNKDAIKPQRMDVVSAKKKPVTPSEETSQPIANDQLVAVGEADKKPVKRKKSKSEKDKPAIVANVVDKSGTELLPTDVQSSVETAPVRAEKAASEEGALVIDNVVQPMRAEKEVAPHKANKRYKSMEALELEPVALPDSPMAGAKSVDSVPKAGLSVKVEGDIPKAYDKASVNAARRAFLLAPVGYSPPSQGERIHFGTDSGAGAAKPAEAAKPAASEQKIGDSHERKSNTSSESSESSSSSDSESDNDTENEINEMVASTLSYRPEDDIHSQSADASLPASENYAPKMKVEKKVSLVPPKSNKVPNDQKVSVAKENYVPLAYESGDPASLPRLPKKSQVSEKQPATQQESVPAQQAPQTGDQPATAQEGLAFALPSVKNTPLIQRSVKPQPESVKPFKQLSMREFGNQIIEPEPVVFSEQFSPKRPVDADSEQVATPLQLAYRLPGSSLANPPNTSTSGISDSMTPSEGSFDFPQLHEPAVKMPVSRESSMKGKKNRQTPPVRSSKEGGSSDDDDYDEHIEEWPEKEDNILGETFHTRRLDLSGSPLDDMLVKNATVEPTIPMELIAEEKLDDMHAPTRKSLIADDTVPFADDEDPYQLPGAQQAELVSVGSNDSGSSSSSESSESSEDEDDDDIGYKEFVDDLHASHGLDDSSLVEHAEQRPSSSVGGTIEQGDVSKHVEHPPFQPDVVITSLSSGSGSSEESSSESDSEEDEEGGIGLEYTASDISAAAGSEALKDMLVGGAATAEDKVPTAQQKPAAKLSVENPNLQRDTNKSPTSYMRIEETYTLEAKTVTKTTLIQQGYVQSAEDIVLLPLNGRRSTDLMNEIPAANVKVNVPGKEDRTPSFSDEPFFESEITMDETTSESYLISEEMSLLPEQYDQDAPAVEEPATKSKRKSKRLSKNIPPPEDDVPAADLYINFSSKASDVSASTSDEPSELYINLPLKPAAANVSAPGEPVNVPSTTGKGSDKPADLYAGKPKLPKSVDVIAPDDLGEDDLNVSIPSFSKPANLSADKPVTGDLYMNIPDHSKVEPSSVDQLHGRPKSADLYVNLPEPKSGAEPFIDIAVQPSANPENSFKRNADSRKSQRKSKSPKRSSQDADASEEPSAEISLPPFKESSIEMPIMSVELPVKVEIEEPSKGRKPSSKSKKFIDLDPVEAKLDDVKATVMDVLKDAEQMSVPEVPQDEVAPKMKRKKSKSREALAAGFDVQPPSVELSLPQADVIPPTGELDVSVSSQEPTRKSRSKLKPSKRSKENLTLLDDITAPAASVEITEPEVSFADDTLGKPEGKKSKRKSKSPNTSRGKISLPLSELDINIDAQAPSVDVGSDDQPAYVNIHKKPTTDDEDHASDDLTKTKQKKSKLREKLSPGKQLDDDGKGQSEEQPIVGELDEEPKLRKKKSKSREKLVPDVELQIQTEDTPVDVLEEEPKLRKKKSKSKEKLASEKLEIDDKNQFEEPAVGELDEEPQLRKKKSKSREKLTILKPDDRQASAGDEPAAVIKLSLPPQLEPVAATEDAEPIDDAPNKKPHNKKSPGTSRKKISLPVVDLDVNIDVVPAKSSDADKDQSTYLNVGHSEPEGGQREGREPEVARNDPGRKSQRKSSKSPRRRSEENLTLPLSVAEPSETCIDEPSAAPSDNVSFATDRTMPSEEPVSDISMVRDDAKRKSTRRKGGKSPKRTSSGSDAPLSPSSEMSSTEFTEEVYVLEGKAVVSKGYTVVAEALVNNAPVDAVVPLVVDTVATPPKSDGDPERKADSGKKRSKSPGGGKGKVVAPSADLDLDLDVDVALPDPSSNAFADQPAYVNVHNDVEDPSAPYMNLGEKIPVDPGFIRDDPSRKSNVRKSKSPKSPSRENLATSPLALASPAAPSSTDEASSVIPTDASFVSDAALPRPPVAAAAPVINDQLIRDDPMRKSQHRKSKSPRRDSAKSPNETASFFPQDGSFTAPVVVEEVYILEGKVKQPKGFVAVAEALYFDAPADKPADEEPLGKGKSKQPKKSPNREQEDLLPTAPVSVEPVSESGRKQRKSKSPDPSRSKIKTPSAELDIDVDLPASTADDPSHPTYVNIYQKPDFGAKSPTVAPPPLPATPAPAVETDLDALLDADVNASVNNSAPFDSSLSFVDDDAKKDAKKPKKDKKKSGDAVEAQIDLPVIGGGGKAELPVIGGKAGLPVIGDGKADEQLVKITTSPGSKRRDIKRKPADDSQLAAGNTDSLPRPPTQKELDQLMSPTVKTPATSGSDTTPVAVAVFVSVPVSPSSKTKQPRGDLAAPVSTENVKPPLSEDDRRKRVVPPTKPHHETDVDMPSGSISFAEISSDVSKFIGDSFDMSFENDRDRQPSNVLKDIGESEEPSESGESDEDEEDEEPSHEKHVEFVLTKTDSSKVHANVPLKAVRPAVDDLESQIPVEPHRAAEDSEDEGQPASAGSGGKLKHPVAKGNYFNLLHPEEIPRGQREPEADLGSETSDSEDEDANGQHPASEHFQRQPDADAEKGKMHRHPTGAADDSRTTSEEEDSDDEHTKEVSGTGSGSSDITPTQRESLASKPLHPGVSADADLHPTWQNPLPPPPPSLLASTSQTSHLPSPPATPPPPPPAEDEESSEEESSEEESGDEGEGQKQVEEDVKPPLHDALAHSLEDRRSQVAPAEESESSSEEEEEEEEEPGVHYFNVIPPPDKEDLSTHYYNVVPTPTGGVVVKSSPLPTSSAKVADKPAEESDASESTSEDEEDEEAANQHQQPVTRAAPSWKPRDEQNAEMERVPQAVSDAKTQPQHQQPAYMGTPLSTDQSSASSPVSHHSSTSNLSDRGLSPQQSPNKQSTPQQQQQSPQRSSVQLTKVPAPQPQSILRRSPDGRGWQPSPVPTEPRNTRSLQDVAYQSFLRASPTRSNDTSRRTPEDTVYVRGTYRPNTVTVWRGGAGMNTSRRLLGDNAGDESAVNMSHMGSMRGSVMPMGMGGDGGVDEPLARSSHVPQQRASNRPGSTAPELSLPPLNLGEDGEELDEEGATGPPSPTPSRPASYFAGPMPFQPAWMAGPFLMPQQQPQQGAQPMMMMMPMPYFVEPKVRPDAQGLDNYDSISRLWMEKNDTETVRKALEKSQLANSKNPNNRSTDSLASAADDRTLWRTAKARERGRQLRQMKRQLDQLAAQLPGGVKGRPGSTTSFLGSPSDDGGRLLYDRLMASPNSNKEMLLLFRVSSNWKDLAWVLFDVIQSDSETIRMIEDIRLKHPHQLREQVEDMMQRWWRKRGPEATIDELQRSLEVVNMAYVTDEIDDKRRSELSMMADVELHDGTEYSQATCEHYDYDDDFNQYAEINDVTHHHDGDAAGDAQPRPEPVPARRAPPPPIVSLSVKDHGRDDVSETSLTRVIPHPQAGADDVNLTVFPPLPPPPSGVAPVIPPRKSHEGDEETSAELQLVVPVEHQPVMMRSKKKKSRSPAPAPGVKVDGRTPPPLPPGPPVTLSMEVPVATYGSTIETDL